MKNIFYITCLLIALSSFSQEDSFCDIQNVRDNSFEILRDMDTSNLAQSTKRMISFDLISVVVNQTEELKDKKDEISQDEIEFKRLNRLRRIVQKSIEYEISWGDIEFENFTYRYTLENGLRNIKGNLYFRFDGGLFNIGVEAIYFNGEYHILGFNRFVQTDSIR